MIGAVLLVGDELLGGVVSDRNIAAIARAVGPRGVILTAAEVVPDDEEVIAAAARRLAEGRDLLVVCGGIGPTSDDRTREALARAMGVGVRVDEPIRERLEAWLAKLGNPSADAAVRQATFPEGTAVVPNPAGSAPAFRGRIGRCEFWVFPGVPAETRELAKVLAESLPDPAERGAWERFVATAGLSEVRAATKLTDGGFEPPAGVALGFLPSPGGVRLRLTSSGGTAAEEMDAAEARMRGILGDSALPLPSLGASLIHALQAAGATLATAESCTGGLLGARITDVPGASSVYLGGIVSYSNRVKTDRLGVPEDLIRTHGAVSEAVAAAMADGCRRRFEAGLAVSVTGIAGPDGGTPDKPVGTVWIGLADAAGVRAEHFRFRGTREMVRERTVNKALEMAYRRLVGPAA